MGDGMPIFGLGREPVKKVLLFLDGVMVPVVVVCMTGKEVVFGEVVVTNGVGRVGVSTDVTGGRDMVGVGKRAGKAAILAGEKEGMVVKLRTEESVTTLTSSNCAPCVLSGSSPLRSTKESVVRVVNVISCEL
ncbi:hypothetical protein FRX31_008865 [Thalictrum thalictroides]|uniref:Uncharacterized protein n=1 Tax=Thalictrum thalictroides TaxID=46969 RepID=A0A7J6WVT5_THATH|nr:hypothetical protein FRX31_008865 [Thalictrum thalictroides]